MKNTKTIEQGTDEWHHIRKGKITGTTLKSIMGSAKTRQDAIYEIVAERLTIGIDDDENAMDRGIRLESDAAAAFELETDLETEKTGFSQNDENPFIANSPDRWIKGLKGGLEIKCPGGKNHVKYWLTNKVPDEYYWQIIQYFVVNDELEEMYFASYNPDIPVHPLHIIKINRTEVLEDIKVARTNQMEFLKEVEVILSNIIEL
jgi:putative phage-type endonuclease